MPNFTKDSRYGQKFVEAIGAVLSSLGSLVVGADASNTRFKIAQWGMIVDRLIEAFWLARMGFERLKLWDDAAREEYAKTVYRMVVGEDASLELMYLSGPTTAH